MSLNLGDRGILNLNSADEIRKLPSRSQSLSKYLKKNSSVRLNMFFHRLTISLILQVAFIIVTARLVVSIPYHGTQIYLGHSYWTQRYSSLGYKEWDGFWNNYYGRRKQYKRDTSGLSCGGCGCDDEKQELDCRGRSPLTL